MAEPATAWSHTSGALALLLFRPSSEDAVHFDPENFLQTLQGMLGWPMCASLVYIHVPFDFV